MRMFALMTLLAVFASGCTDRDPASSSRDGAAIEPAARLTVSGGAASGATAGPTARTSLDDAPAAEGRTVSAAPAGGANERSSVVRPARETDIEWVTVVHQYEGSSTSRTFRQPFTAATIEYDAGTEFYLNISIKGAYPVYYTVTRNGATIVDHRATNQSPFNTQPFSGDGTYEVTLEGCDEQVVFTMAAAAGELTVQLPGGASMELVWIEPGTFMMGSPASETGRSDDEGPLHEVTISHGFWLAKYEVTQVQWESVMDYRPWDGKGSVHEGPSFPAVWLNNTDVRNLVDAMNALPDMGGTFRMPTEAEWEYACRAGTATAWSFGSDASLLAQYAWFGSNAGGAVAQEVGQLLPNPWGLYDMHGNVKEWVSDRYSATYYAESPETDPLNLTGVHGVMRSGDVYHGVAATRSAARYMYGLSVSHSNYNTGGRLLQVP